MSPTVGSADVARFRSAVAVRMGLQYDDTKSAFLAEVLGRRIEATRRSASEYLASLETDAPDEVAALARELTVSETYFFRNQNQFRAYAEVCLPDRIAAQASNRKLRILSLGCSTGEEPYSLSILARENVDPAWQVTIRAADVNPVVLEKAARARYSSWALRETAPEAVRRWFRVGDREAVLDETIRDSVQFEQRNLIDENPMFWLPAAYDVVFCRNVIMYFTPTSAFAVLERIALTLAPGGYLFLGHAETLRGLSTAFHLRHTHGTFYYQRRRWLEQSETSPPTRAAIVQDPSPPTRANGEGWIEAIRHASERIEILTAPRPSAKPAKEATPPDLGGVVSLMHDERYATALDLVEALAPASESDPDLLLLRAVLLVHSGRLAEAESAAMKLLEIDDLNAGAHYVVALCRDGASDPKGAMEHDQIAVHLDAAFAMPRLHLGLFARRSGDQETAREELSHALVLLQREEPARILLFGGGFRREVLIALCKAELATCRGHE